MFIKKLFENVLFTNLYHFVFSELKIFRITPNTLPTLSYIQNNVKSTMYAFAGYAICCSKFKKFPHKRLAQ